MKAATPAQAEYLSMPPKPSNTVPRKVTANGLDDRHLTRTGRIEKRLDELRELKRIRGEQ